MTRATTATSVGPATAILVGAGSRGTMYASYALERPGELRVVGVAEPRAAARDQVTAAHHLPPDRMWSDWRQLAASDRLSDAVIIALQDSLHAEAAIAFARKGYHILLEKPMAPTLEECEEVARACRDANILMAVCHTFRYTATTRRIKQIIADGLIGDVVSIQHFEPIGYWHFPHAYVRGPWRREDESGPLLLTKGCHDIDWIHFLVGTPCLSVSSFGSLVHFRKENQPPGAGERCDRCSVEAACPYSARKLYFGNLARGEAGWPVDTVARRPTEESLTEALADGPYGRCVYDCDNNVVDNQVVNLLFQGGITATYTLNALNKDGGRKTRIYGTKGELHVDGGNGRLLNGRWFFDDVCFRRFDFLTDTFVDEHVADEPETLLSGHDFGDYYLMEAFTQAIRRKSPVTIRTGPEVTLESHSTVFAAERSRRSGRTVHIRW
jgi:predicted dehydrogenase